MDLQLKGKGALVTGGSQGIGFAIALALAREGCRVAICARNADDLEAAARQIRETGATVVAIRADVCAPADAVRLIEETLSQLNGLDILVNNVGGAAGGGFFETSDQDWQTTFEINVHSIVRLIRLAVPHMRSRKGASIVNVSSISGWVTQLAGSAQYGSSKAAQLFLTEPLALELAPLGIRVNNVAPGSICFPDGAWDGVRQQKPEFFEEFVRESFPMGRLGTVEEVADAVTFLVSPRAGWINGRTLSVDGLQQPISQRLLKALFGRK
jgi:3-oxoacyl-[acyl-carrier protein] reductase